MNDVKTILEKNGLDFIIEKIPLIGINSIGEQVISPYYGLLNNKTGEIINTCKEGYTVSQNAEVVKMVLKGMSKFGDALTVQKAGSIHGGRRVYMQMAIEGTSKVNDDIIKRFVTVIDSNDGSTGLSVGISDLTMSCENQFFKFYKAGEAKFRHTATIAAKIQTIPLLIQTALDKSLEQIKIYTKFASTAVSRELANEMVNSILGYDRLHIPEKGLTKRSEDMMNSLYGHITKEMNQKGENLWGLHSGVTSWTTHDKAGPKRVNGKEESMLLGTAYQKNQASLNFALNRAGLVMA
jgi:hypothetical protein